jgi:hypothetical protein
MKSYLYARKVGVIGTYLIEMSKKNAMKIIKEEKEINDYLGIICSNNFKDLKLTYGEYVPFKKLETIEELKEHLKDKEDVFLEENSFYNFEIEENLNVKIKNGTPKVAA